MFILKYVYKLQKNIVFYRALDQVENLVGDNSDICHKGFQTTNDQKYGFANSSIMKLGTSMEFGVVVELPGWAKEGVSILEAKCKDFNLRAYKNSGSHCQRQGKIFIVYWDKLICFVQVLLYSFEVPFG